MRRGEIYGLWIRDIDLDGDLVHVAFSYVVRGGQRFRKNAKTYQDRWLTHDPDTATLVMTYLDEIKAELAASASPSCGTMLIRSSTWAGELLPTSKLTSGSAVQSS